MLLVRAPSRSTKTTGNEMVMSKLFFYDSPVLPSGFRFPRGYVRLAQTQDLPDLEPWSFLFLNMPDSLIYYGEMLHRYPDKPLVPFAWVNDQMGYYNDVYVVLACFDGDDTSGDPKVYIHDYAEPRRLAWSELYSFANFTEWLRKAREESVSYKALLAEARSL